METFTLPYTLPIERVNGGYFISPNVGHHPTRVIDSYELIFVIEGQLDLFEAEQSFVISPNHALILWPGRKHGSTASYPPQLKFYWMHFHLTQTATKSKGLKLPGGVELSGGLELPKHVHIAQPARMIALLRMLISEQELNHPSPPILTLIAMHVLAEFSEQSIHPTHHGATDDYLNYRIQNFIDSHFNEDISADAVSSTLGYNADYLNRRFRQALRMTITEAIQRRRIKEARRLLVESSLSIKQIADCCGMNNTSYFARLFKRYEGMPPRTYRQLHVRTHINRR